MATVSRGALATVVFVSAVTAFTSFGARAYEVEVISETGDPANRVDLVIMGDGYREEDQGKLTSDVESFLADFWAESPYGVYKDYFNVKLVHVVSNQNGADYGTYGTERDTALGAGYNCNNIDRLICVDMGSVLSVARDNVPDYDYIFVIVNDPKYGGSGGTVAVFSTNQSASEVAEHEFGHTLGKLADEYEDPYPGYPSCRGDCPEPNATLKTNRNEIKWSIWIDPGTPLPTPETSSYANDVGAFEGCRYQPTGVYRPKQSCKMRSLNKGFCEVCKEALALRIYDKVDPIDRVEPEGDVTVSVSEKTIFRVFHPSPARGGMDVTWYLDGNEIASGNDVLELDASNAGTGEHELSVEVKDASGIIRNDPSQVSISTRTWTVLITGGDGGADVAGEGADVFAEAREVGDEGMTEQDRDDLEEWDAGAEKDEGPLDSTGAGDYDMEFETDARAESGEPAEEIEPSRGDGIEGTCEPGVRTCDGKTRFMVCKDDGTGYEIGGDCKTGEVCWQGRCVKTSSSGSGDSGCGCGAAPGVEPYSWLLWTACLVPAIRRRTLPGE